MVKCGATKAIFATVKSHLDIIEQLLFAAENGWIMYIFNGDLGKGKKKKKEQRWFLSFFTS